MQSINILLKAHQTKQKKVPLKLSNIFFLYVLTTFQEVEEFNHGRWYKKMYNTIHKAKDDDGKKSHEQNCFLKNELL